MERRFLGPYLGWAVLAVVVFFLRAGHSSSLPDWASLGAGQGVSEPERPRLTVGTEFINVWIPEEFLDLQRVVGGPGRTPGLEAVHRAMEVHGWTEMRYVMRLRFHTDDGRFDDIDYIRRPYRAPRQASEFLGLLQSARQGLGGVEIEADGRVLDGFEAARRLGLDRNDAPEAFGRLPAER